jgi:DNA-binding transcriptional MerR regulator
MSQPGEDLREELDLDEGEGVLVDRVIEGLPAAKAGLKQGDVIVEFDGERPVSAQTIREVLEKKDVGDTVNVTVLREGESKRLKVKLAEYNPGKFGMPGAWVGGGGPGGIYQVQPLEGLDHEQMKKLMDEHMKQFGQGGGAAPRVWGPSGEQNMRFFVPGAKNEETDAKMAELEARMKELDKKLQRLSEQLTRLQKSLDKAGE